jgi:hypothetical protein
MYLLDTDVVSELRKRRGDSGVQKVGGWAERGGSDS